MDQVLAFVIMLLLAATFWTFALTIPLVLLGVLVLLALWIGWAFFDRWWVERKAENSNPSPLRDQRA